MNVIRCGLRKQLKDVWRIVFYAGLILVAAIVSNLATTSGVAIGIVCGAIGGVIGHWRATGPSSIEIGRNLVPLAKNWFEAKGYEMCGNKNEMVPKLPRLLRFNSQNVQFVSKKERDTVVGPHYLLRGFEKTLHG